MLNGMRRRKASHCGRPQEDFFHLRKPTMMATAPAIRKYHWPVTALESPTVKRVISGSSPPKSSNTPTNTGTMKAIMPIRTSIAKLNTTIG